MTFHFNNNVLLVLCLLILLFTYMACHYSLRKLKKNTKIKMVEPQLFNLFTPWEPEPELVAFADAFSQQFILNGKVMSEGNYSSPDYKHHIRLMNHLLTIEGEPSMTNARVNIATGVIDLGKEKLIKDQATADYVFYLILYCTLQRHVESLFVCDIKALNFYATTGRSFQPILHGMVTVLGDHQHAEINKERLLMIKEFIALNGR